jgi:hypothetical protein
MVPEQPTLSADVLHADPLQVRHRLISHLSSHLGGDLIAAEYLLLNLLSRVFARKGVVAVGNMALNLTQISIVDPNRSLGDFVSSLYGFLSGVCGHVELLTLSIDTLNRDRFVPAKDYDQGKLLRGRLQLAPFTHVVVDELAMQEGQLQARGLNNLKELTEAMQWQKVSYNFEYYPVEMETNVTYTVLSEGRRAMVSTPDSVVVPLVKTSPVSGAFDQTQEWPDEFVASVREYFAVIPHIQYELSDEMSEMVGNDFVAMRQSQGDQMTPEMLGQLLVITRLIAVSRGESVASSEVWEQAKALEHERLCRVALTEPPQRSVEE